MIREMANKELKKRVWFYFIQQKVIEISILPTITILPYLVGKYVLQFLDKYGYTVFQKWMIGLFIILSSIMVLVMIGGLGYLFIKANWDWAKRRAERYFKK